MVYSRWCDISPVAPRVGKIVSQSSANHLSWEQGRPRLEPAKSKIFPYLRCNVDAKSMVRSKIATRGVPRCLSLTTSKVHPHNPQHFEQV